MEGASRLLKRMYSICEVYFKKKIIYKKIKLPYYSNMQTFLCQKTPHSLAPSLSLSLFLSFSLFNIPTLITILSTYSLLHSKERYPFIKFSVHRYIDSFFGHHEGDPDHAMIMMDNIMECNFWSTISYTI